MKSLSLTFIRTAAALLLALAATLAVTHAPDVAAHRAATPPPATSGPNLLVNGSFERGVDPGTQLAVPAGTTVLPGWTVVNPGYAVYEMGTAWQAEDGTRSLSLANPVVGNLKSAGGVTQTVATTPGHRYLLTFYQAGNPSYPQPMALQVQVAGQTSTSTEQADAQARPQHLEWVQHAITFTATAPHTTLAFTAYLTCCNVGLGLDNVQMHALALPAKPALGVGGGTPQPGVITGTLTVQIAWPASAAGGTQVIQGAAGKKAAVALVVDYPDGTQLLAPLTAGPDGHFTYTWKLPSTVHGTVHLLVDSASKTARGSFVVR